MRVHGQAGAIALQIGDQGRGVGVAAGGRVREARATIARSRRDGRGWSPARPRVMASADAGAGVAVSSQ